MHFSVMALKTGLTVELHGLSKTPELNGHLGCLRNYDSVANRWEVEIAGLGFRKIKADNLRAPLPKVPRKVKLCRYGSMCHRLDCWLTHANPRDRCEHFVSTWSALLGHTDSVEHELPEDVLPQINACKDDVESLAASLDEQDKSLEMFAADLNVLRQQTEVLQDRISKLDACSNTTKGNAVESPSKLQALVDDACPRQLLLHNSDMRDELHELVRDAMDTQIDEKLDEVVRNLVFVAMKGALTPLAQKFDDEMKRFEARLHGQGHLNDG